MSSENKSESIDFENEQIEQRTLDSDEQRKIKKSEEAKNFNTTNNFNKKFKDQKNKSQNKFNKTKLPLINKQRKEPVYSSVREPIGNSVFATSYSTVNIDPIDNDELFLELHKAQKEIKNINKEIKNLQKEYNIIEESNITNKYLIEKILKIDDTNSNANSKNDRITEEIL